jgi:hypothetical protein
MGKVTFQGYRVETKSEKNYLLGYHVLSCPWKEFGEFLRLSIGERFLKHQLGKRS